MESVINTGDIYSVGGYGVMGCVNNTVIATMLGYDIIGCVYNTDDIYSVVCLVS